MTLLIATIMTANLNLIQSLPSVPREFRGAWVATVANIDWPSKRDLSSEQQQAELLKIIENARALRLNALVFQIRPSGDALYKSKLEPWSEYLTGRQGKAPNPEWDPLEFAVREAHARGIELHCWFNPYRANHPSQLNPWCSTHICSTYPSAVKTYDKYKWMDPGEKVVQQHSQEVILDVVKRYDIDGVHLDDYFYPYPVNDGNKQKIDFPDGPSWTRYQQSGGRLRRGDWRRKNCDDFIENLYKGIKGIKKSVKFGISPFGIARPGVPAGIKAGIDQYSELYADAQKWLEEGWCDYYAPQLYWAISSPGQPFKPLLNYWVKTNKMNRHVWAGLYTSRLDPKEGNYKLAEINDQVVASRQGQPSQGNIHFSYKALANNNQNVATSLKNGLYAKDAFIPESPWLGAKQPRSPRIVKSSALAFEVSNPDQFMAICYGRLKDPNGDDSPDNVDWGSWMNYQSGKEISLSATEKGPVAAITFSKTGIASDPVIQPTMK